MESTNTVGCLESRFSVSFQGGRYSLTMAADWCWWGLYFMQDKYRYGCAPVWRFCTVSSRQIRPSDGKLLFLPKQLPSVLTLIHYKKVQSISQRSPIRKRVETWLVISSPLFRNVSKEGRYSLTTMADCCHSQYPSTNITPDTMWMGLGGVGGVATSCKASIGIAVLQFGDFAWFQAGKSIPATVDCCFSQSNCPLYLPSYITRRFRAFHRGILYKRE